MRRVHALLLALGCATAGWLGSTAERQAHAQVTPPGALAGEPIDVGEADGVRVFMVRRNTDRCYFTSPGGGISCL